MAVETCAECIERVLATLSQDDRERFVHKLAERSFEPRVLLSTVEKKRYWEVATVMVNTFQDKRAVEVAVELFNKMGLEKKAEELVELAKECGYEPSGFTQVPQVQRNINLT